VAAELEFCLLGSLVVRRGAVPVAVPRGKQRVILAMLLLNAGRVVRLDELTETLWDGGPPPSGPVAVQNHVMRLRNALGEAGRDRIVTAPPGYLIRVEAAELDVSCFEALLGAARGAARDRLWDQAAAKAREALRLWRGEPLADVGSEVLTAREAPRLAELRLQALQIRIDAELHLGRHGEVIAELQQLVGAYPLRERLYGQLMLALYRDSRQGEALAAYQQARRALVDELGTEPGPDLRQLHQQILDADPALIIPAPLAAGSAASVVPRELPAAVGNFTGRTDELEMLTSLIDGSGEEVPGTVVISAIGGTAGVGKTALAVHWAHQVADRFPDGQLYVNLRGYDAAQPVPAGDALARFLRGLGVPGQEIPPEEDERAARYRSLLSGKRILVVLDNARDVEQVRPLLPASSGCTVLVTSRDSLTGLVARDGATRLDLDLLPSADAVRLLRALIGPRADTDPEATAALAAQCCRLPLALRVAAELSAARPAVALADLAEELADQRRRLDLLDGGGDPAIAVRAVFSWSYRHLDADTGRTFRLAGLHPGPDLEPYAAAALTGTTVAQAGRLLDRLARAHLIEPARAGWYGMHDLLRAYASELAVALDSEEERQSALTRLFDYFLHTAAAATAMLYPGERHRQPDMQPSATPLPPLASAAAAQSWLDDERATLAAVAVHAAEHGWPGHATSLAAILFPYLNLGGHYPEAVTVYAHAASAAHRRGDDAAEAAALNALGTIDWRQARYEQACDRLQQAQQMFRTAGDRVGQARALGNLGLTYVNQGHFQAAVSAFGQVLSLFRQIADRSGEVRTLCNLGIVEERIGLYHQAASHQEESISIAREIGAQDTEYLALLNLGVVRLRQGRCTQASDDLRRALAMFREAGYRPYEAVTLTRIGDVCLRQGSPHEAVGYLQKGLSLFREIGDRSGEADALNSLGEVLIATSRFNEAHARHTAALDLADPIGDKYEQARAHNGLGHACHASGQRDQGRRHWHTALELYTSLGVPEADGVRVQLVQGDQNTSPGRGSPQPPRC
jgi:DNA-binding SARP family transcriptional activator/Tfp pilus assembly protein PilF